MASSLAAAASATGGNSPAGTSTRPTIAQNFDTFLTLLTTQLKNQNPLEPLNANEFTQQLVQFSSVEQQLKTNDTLAALLKSSRTATVANAATFVGATITADGTATQLAGGRATWRLDAPRAAAATITITDAKGNVIATERKALSAGMQEYSWNGRTSTGGYAPDGTYSIRVDALDANNQQIVVKSEIAGTVSGVDLTGDSPMLLVGSAKVALEQVKSVKR